MPTLPNSASTFSQSAPSRDHITHAPVLAERQQGLLGHGINRVGGGQCAYMKDVGGFGILGAGAGEEEALRARPMID
jgi:hypothetical protein